MPLISQECVGQSIGSATELITLLIQTLATSHCNIAPASMWPQDYGPTALIYGLQQYDYIITGAGAAGSILANRLSEDPYRTVLLLEAGGDPPMETEIPFLFFTLENTTVDWKFWAEKSSRFSTGLTRGVPFPRGKMLGGTGNMNALFYVRGNPKDYNDWEELGNPTWNWKNVLKYFKKTENMIVKEILELYRSYHGVGGYMSVDLFKSVNPNKNILLDALEEIGDEILLDINSGNQMGSTQATGFLAYGTRQGPAKVFLSTVKNRPNLHIIKNAHVTSFNIDGRGKVNGVNFRLNNQYDWTAYAKKDYILSAGALNSPQILMQSGIGPKHHLMQMGIPQYFDLPVGENLMDHVYVTTFYEVPNTEIVNVEKLTLLSYAQYLLGREGFFASSFSSDVITFFNTKNSRSTYPDIQVHYGIADRGNEKALQGYLNNVGYDVKFQESVLSVLEDSSIIIMAITLLSPKSKGKIKLRSNNPFDKVRILPNYLDHPDDMKALLRGVRRQQKVLDSHAFREHGIREFHPYIEDCQNLDSYSDKYWKCYIKYTLTTLYHPCGTVKMGAKRDSTAVVDSRLRVHGVSNLVVADASIMPIIVRGNTHAPTVMIGEMAADFIKKDWYGKDY